MAQNPYDTLGVPKNASIDEIKSQYRKLALRFHPDKSNSKYAEENFKEISHAYDILSDPIKREAFDKNESDDNKETQKTRQTESTQKVWLGQLKTMGRELLRLIQKYAQNAQNKNFEYNNSNHGFQNESNFSDDISNWVGTTNFVGPQFKSEPKQKRKQENFEKPWVNASEKDAKLANEIFGVKNPRKKYNGQRNYDYGFNMEDVFDL